MRINIYSQELTDLVEQVTSRPIGEEDPVFYAARLYLHSAPGLHDDDQSGITFWLPKSPERREAMARAFEEIAGIFRNAPLSC